MTNIELGEEVRVFDVNQGLHGQPEGGWPGLAVKVGRKLVTIHYRAQNSFGEGDTFRIDTGQKNDGYGHRSFKTLDQVARDERRRHAMETLKRHHIELTAPSKLTVEQVEALAEVAATFDTDPGQERS